MIKVFRLETAGTCPRLALTDLSAGSPEDWVRGIDVPDNNQLRGSRLRVISTAIDRPAQEREFCALTPGTLVVPEQSLDDGSGPNSVYYALWMATQRVDLDVDGTPFVCFIPYVILEPDRRSGAPCPVDRFYFPVFRIAGRPPSEIYCASGVIEGGDEFVHVYETDGFRGLDFELVWQGERVANP